MLIDWRCTPRPLVVLILAILLSTVDLTGVLAAQTASPPAPADNTATDSAKTVRAYDQPIPNSAKFRIVTLTVIDDETNKPLADAEVLVLNDVDANYHSFPTDVRGRLRIVYPYMSAKPTLSLELRKNGYVPLRHGWGFEKNANEPANAVTIRLRRGTTMGGIVVSSDDRPVEGATVVMTVSKDGPTKRPMNPSGHEIYYEVPSRTGRDGRWRTDSVPPSAVEINLQLIHPDFVSDGSTTLGMKGRSPAIAALRELTDRQVLVKGVKINGRVLDDHGKPIARAEVVDSSRGLTFLPYVQRVSTDPEGRFHLHLPRGEVVELTARARGYQPVPLKAPTEPDVPPIEFCLAPARMLRGRIVDPKGKAIAGASLIGPAFGKHRGIFVRAWTDAEGRFEWDSAPADSVAFSISAEGYVPIDRVALDPSIKEAVVVLKPSLDVSLRVVDAGTGELIPRFTVQIGTASEGNQEFHRGRGAVVALNGSYHTSLEGENARHQFKVTADGYAPAQTRIISGDEKTIREIIKLERK
jgi:hypothetical protein